MPRKSNKNKILLIEDDLFLAGMYQTKLKLEGFDVKLAADGKQGTKMIKSELPDLVLLDIILPGMTGFEILKKMKRDSSTKNIPVILLTNLGQKDDVSKGLELGAEDYLIKAHFMPSEVVGKIKKLLG